jgi:CubicO group peptidase (beta-lactamase class C family)
VDGHCDARFEAVRDALAGNFREHDERGAAVSVRVDGRSVVDLWGGHRDLAGRSPWQRDTLVNVYSVGKGILAALALGLVERGIVDLDRPVAELWPEFGVEGKQDVCLRTLLAHRAGLPAVRRRLPEGSMYDWSLMCRELAAQPPYWEPGSAHGYHVNTFGYLVGELLRRATGLDVGSALHRYLGGPLRADFFWGLPPQHHVRVADVHMIDVKLRGPEQWAMAFPPTGDDEHDSMVWHCYFNPDGISGLGVVNSDAWRTAQIPSTNGQGTARAVSAIYAALLPGPSAALPAGERWIGDELQAEAVRIHSDGEDRVLGRPSRFGLGFQLAQPGRPLGPNREAFGHFGHGGSLGFADPVARVAFCFLTSRPGQRWQTTRAERLVDAVYESLA